MKKIKNYIPITLMLSVAIVLCVLTLCGIWDVDKILATVQDNKITAFFVIMALFLVKGFSLAIPYGVVLVGSGLVYGLVPSIVINLIGSVLCFSASYFVGRFSKSLTFESVIERYPKYGRYFDNASRNSFVSCYIIHALHLPTEIQGVLFGLIRTPYLAYISASIIALLPNMLCYTVLGSERDFENPLLWLFLGLDAIVLIAGIILGKKKIFKK